MTSGRQRRLTAGLPGLFAIAIKPRRPSGVVRPKQKISKIGAIGYFVETSNQMFPQITGSSIKCNGHWLFVFFLDVPRKQAFKMASTSGEGANAIQTLLAKKVKDSLRSAVGAGT